MELTTEEFALVVIHISGYIKHVNGFYWLFNEAAVAIQAMSDVGIEQPRLNALSWDQLLHERLFHMAISLKA